MRLAIGARLSAARRLGPRRAAARAGSLAAVHCGGAARGLRLRVAPRRVSPGELARAIGPDPVAALRGPVLRALPTVATLDLGPAGTDLDDLLRRADAIVAHRFDLLGSGPVELGDTIDWQLDFKSGRRWPKRHIARVPIAYPDGSDIKVPWELSRFQHLPLLAAAARQSGDRRYREEIGRQLDAWIDANPVEIGVNWACAMDVAIRAANWIAALALVAEDVRREPWLARALGSLLLHGRFLRAHLETSAVRGNHYLADIVGLATIGTLFLHGSEGAAWVDFCAREIEREMAHQVHPDGVDHEASIPYHRLVCELFVCATHVVDAFAPSRLGAAYRERLARMLSFVADYTRPDGLAPQIGDADDGRFLPLLDYGVADVRSHLHLFAQAQTPLAAARGHAAYRDGGFYVMRAAPLYAIVHCGDTGMRGRGGHGHNDQLAFELCVHDRPLIVDPGSYLYTADPDARDLFRSTRSHATLMIDGAEQNELAGAEIFSLADQSRAELVTWRPDGSRAMFEGLHHGYERLPEPATHSRQIELDAARRRLVVIDRVDSRGPHDLDWCFPLDQTAKVRVMPAAVTATVGATQLTIAARDVEFRVEPGWYSPSYGRRTRAPFVRASRRAAAPGETRFELTVA